MARCVVYLRVSTRNQANKHGLTRQLETCLNHAREQGVIVYGVFVDIASGSGELPQRALAIAESKRLSCPVFIETYCRWSRRGNDETYSTTYLAICEPLAIGFENKLREIMGGLLGAT